MSEIRSNSLISSEHNCYPVKQLHDEEEYIFTLREVELLLDIVESPGEENNPRNSHLVSAESSNMDAQVGHLEEQFRGLAAQM